MVNCITHLSIANGYEVIAFYSHNGFSKVLQRISIWSKPPTISPLLPLYLQSIFYQFCRYTSCY